MNERIRRQVEKFGLNASEGSCESCGQHVGRGEGVERRPGVATHAYLSGSCFRVDGTAVRHVTLVTDPNWTSINGCMAYDR